MLKGKAKEDFEKWVFKNVKHHTTEKPKFGGNAGEFEFNSEFYRLPFSMQYGVLIDWFDSVGICVDVLKTDYNKMYNFDVCDELANDMPAYGAALPTRTQARQKAIEKANEIYNNRV